MNIGALNNIVEKILIPKYPWIKGYVWTSHYSDGYSYHSLEVTVDKDFYLYRTDTTDLHHKLFRDAKMLFKMVGPEKSEVFDDVVILPE